MKEYQACQQSLQFDIVHTCSAEPKIKSNIHKIMIVW